MTEKYPYKRREKQVRGEGGKIRVPTPYDDADRILRKGWACKEISVPMTLVYEDLLNQLFDQWLSTEYHEVKTREYLFQQARALGAVQAQIEQSQILLKNYNLQKGEDEDASS